MKKRKSIKLSLIALGMLIILGGTTAFAATYYHETGFGNEAVMLKYWKDSSVATYGYTNYSDTGLDAWRDITDNLTIDEVTSQPTYGSIVIYVGTSIAGMDVYGVVDYWTYGFFG